MFSALCDRVVARYKDLYDRCHVDEYALERSNFSTGHMFLVSSYSDAY